MPGGPSQHVFGNRLRLSCACVNGKHCLHARMHTHKPKQAGAHSHRIRPHTQRRAPRAHYTHVKGQRSDKEAVQWSRAANRGASAVSSGGPTSGASSRLHAQVNDPCDALVRHALGAAQPTLRWLLSYNNFLLTGLRSTTSDDVVDPPRHSAGRGRGIVRSIGTSQQSVTACVWGGGGGPVQGFAQ